MNYEIGSIVLCEVGIVPGTFCMVYRSSQCCYLQIMVGVVFFIQCFMISLMNSINWNHLYKIIGTILVDFGKSSFRSLILGFVTRGGFVPYFGIESKDSIFLRSIINDTGQQIL